MSRWTRRRIRSGCHPTRKQLSRLLDKMLRTQLNLLRELDAAETQYEKAMQRNQWLNNRIIALEQTVDRLEAERLQDGRYDIGCE